MYWFWIRIWCLIDFEYFSGKLEILSWNSVGFHQGFSCRRLLLLCRSPFLPCFYCVPNNSKKFLAVSPLNLPYSCIKHRNPLITLIQAYQVDNDRISFIGQYLCRNPWRFVVILLWYKVQKSGDSVDSMLKQIC